VRGNYINYGLAIGSDTSQGRPGDALEYTAAAGGASFIIGKKDYLAEIEGTYSYGTDTPDFWRRENKSFPMHGARFTGKPAYFHHIISATNGLTKKLGLEIKDFDYVVFHMPNGKFPTTVCNIFKIPKDRYMPGLVVTKIGNCYSGSSPIGLCATLDIAKPGDRILLTSFGSGAGSDSFSIVVTEKILKKRKLAPTTDYYINKKKNIDYGTYVKLRKKLKSE